MLLTFEQLLILMLAVTASVIAIIYCTIFITLKAFGFSPLRGSVDYNTSNYQIKEYDDYIRSYEEVGGVPEEFGRMPDTSAGSTPYSSDLRVTELQNELEQLKRDTQLKEFINIPKPLTIYDIPEEQLSSDLYDEDVEIITPEFERFMEEKTRGTSTRE